MSTAPSIHATLTLRVGVQAPFDAADRSVDAIHLQPDSGLLFRFRFVGGGGLTLLSGNGESRVTEDLEIGRLADLVAKSDRRADSAQGWMLHNCVCATGPTP